MQSACFTGHRSLSGDIAKLTERLYDTIEQGILNLGLTHFYAGGSTGFDELAARTVLKLRELYPHIKLHLILPCSNEEQTAKWTEAQKAEFYRILSLVNTVEYTSEHYYNGCMKVRNARLVELADCCYCYYNPNRHRSGTAQTVRMAQRKNTVLINFYSS